jgi:hypothetical protein
MYHISALFILLMAAPVALTAQQAVLQGTVRDRTTQEPVTGVTVVLDGTEPLIGAVTDVGGRFRIVAPAGSYNVRFSFIGYKTEIRFNLVLTTGNANVISVALEEDRLTLGEISVRADRAVSISTVETPLSIQRLTSEEIRSNPGGNFDISKVVQTLPGVGASVGSGPRNDLIIRGGAPNENVYYLDGIEIPVINHFATQGSSGGPQGLLNVSFIEDVTMSTSAFDARYDNTLSAVFDFRQRDGNREEMQGTFRLSGTEVSLTGEGPVGQTGTYLASIRRSYLRFLFEAIDLPIRPDYWDAQFKLSWEPDPKTQVTLLGVGALDEFFFAVPSESTPEKEAVLRGNPIINQWNYTLGVSVRRRITDGFINLALSRNEFDNDLVRWEDARTGDPEALALDVDSRETETKLRTDLNLFKNGWKFSTGLNLQRAEYTSDYFGRIRRIPLVEARFSTDLAFWRMGGFIQASRPFLDERLTVSAGIRTDLDTFTDEGADPLETLSPRVAISYRLTPTFFVNASAGRYHKMPIYTVLGYRDANGDFANRDNRYTRSDHLVAGVELLPREGLRVTAEAFRKTYSRYPVSVRNGISLANSGSETGAIGNERTVSTGTGRAWGAEFLAQQKFTGRVYGVAAYTWVNSEFTGSDSRYRPSSWDSRHILSTLFGWKIGRGYELGVKYRYLAGFPFTPYDLTASKTNYLSTGSPIFDFDRLNEERLRAFSQLDIRIDKKWNFDKVTVDLFLDIQNLLRAKSPALATYTFERNPDGSYATTDGQPVRPDGSNAIPLLIPNDDPFFLPSIGLIIEF